MVCSVAVPVATGADQTPPSARWPLGCAVPLPLTWTCPLPFGWTAGGATVGALVSATIVRVSAVGSRPETIVTLAGANSCAAVVAESRFDGPINASLGGAKLSGCMDAALGDVTRLEKKPAERGKSSSGLKLSP